MESFGNIYWILGGLGKKGDKFKLNKKYFSNINAFVYGKDKTLLSKILINKIKFKVSENLNNSLKLIFEDLKKNSREKKHMLKNNNKAPYVQTI